MQRRPLWSRRVCLLLVAALALSVAVPPGRQDPPGGSHFPLASLWRMLAASQVWAFDPPYTPGDATVVHTTAHHRFWDEASDSWVYAEDLRTGNSVLVGPDGRALHVVGVRAIAGTKRMRDLTVAAVHTYYVVAGDRAVLVHNEIDCGPGFYENSYGSNEVGAGISAALDKDGVISLVVQKVQGTPVRSCFAI